MISSFIYQLIYFRPVATRNNVGYNNATRVLCLEFHYGREKREDINIFLLNSCTTPKFSIKNDLYRRCFITLVT